MSKMSVFRILVKPCGYTCDRASLVITTTNKANSLGNATAKALTKLSLVVLTHNWSHAISHCPAGGPGRSNSAKFT